MPVFNTYWCPHCRHRFSSQQTRATHLKRRAEMGRCPVNAGGYQPRRFTYFQDLQKAGLVPAVVPKDKEVAAVQTFDPMWT